MRADFVGPEPRHRLVEQQHPRLVGERHRQFELAVLAVAHAGDDGIGAMAEADALERGARRLAQLGLRSRASRQNRNEWPAWACTASATLSSAVKCGNSDVIWNERASPSRLRSCTGSAVMSLAVEMDAAGVRRDLAGELADQRGLAGAVRPDDGVQLAARDVEPHVVGGDHAAEALGQAVDLEQRVSHGAAPSSRPSMPPRANSTTSSSIGPR